MDTPSDSAIETTGLTKIYGQTRAVDGVNLTVRRGMIFGFLGPNGAGKTTTIRMLATLIRPDAGSARIFGHDIVREADAVRGRVALTGQFASVDGDLTGLENLMLLGRLQGLAWARARARAHELLEAFDLTRAAGHIAKKYSGGMRRRLDIAASLVVMPDLLFLDEPTTGLDPRSRNMIWEVVRALVVRGSTVMLTTQYLEEADQLADRIAVIEHGAIIAEGTSAQLKASVGASAAHVRLANPNQRPQAAETLSQALATPAHLEADPAALSARIVAEPGVATAGDAGARAVLALDALARAGIAVSEFTLGQPSLDEVFLALTGRPTQGAESGANHQEVAS